MKQNQTAAIFGGDARMLSCAEALRAAGEKVCLFGFEDDPAVRKACVSMEEAAQAEQIILPLPVSRDGKHLFAPFARKPIEMNDAMAELFKGRKVYCGVSENLPDTPAWQALQVTDYYRNDTLLGENARITAEAALFEVMSEIPDTMFHTRFLVSGFGRIGKALTLQLRGLGAQVTVAARRPADRALARTMGAQTVSFRAAMPPCDVVLNTVPAAVFSAQRPLPPETKLYVNIAAGGTPEPEAGETKVIRASALPGKYAPHAAGYAIAAALLEEEETP